MIVNILFQVRAFRDASELNKFFIRNKESKYLEKFAEQYLYRTK